MEKISSMRHGNDFSNWLEGHGIKIWKKKQIHKNI